MDANYIEGLNFHFMKQQSLMNGSPVTEICIYAKADAMISMVLVVAGLSQIIVIGQAKPF